MTEFLNVFSGLNPWVVASLVLAIFFVLSFEFINGFHDTANAVATVIYTRAMSPYKAVMLSGFFNFLGVALGGVGVAYAIVHLLPVELLINVEGGHGLAMVFSLLAAAIAWNLGTWYLGIPASSSHTLIGSVLGVGIANALLREFPLAQSVNWQKAIDIALSLLLSPLMGFLVAGLMLLALKRWRPRSRMHRPPRMEIELKRRRRPPFWNRLVLVISALAVSFVHGSNDGQKGVGLIMLVLICFVPAHFVLNPDASAYQIDRSRDAARYLARVFTQHQPALDAQFPASVADEKTDVARYQCEVTQTAATVRRLLGHLDQRNDYRQLNAEARAEVRRDLLCLDDVAKKIARLKALSAQTQSDLKRVRKDLTVTTEYAPLWVVAAVALALGLGTVVGWKRVVQTVGERIGKAGMTYAQGMGAQITAVFAIGAANYYSLPVSTTHVLSSGIAGTMVANRSGLQTDTIRNILLTWVLTLPVAMLLGGGLFWLSSRFI
ncbi:MAG: inorganic phosphate transporter [Zoogloeaceae bacterium]|jgi:low-affinity inorganic phosphate transporter|nr:inorganic phosphate transporter [Zoogloeaceae bacterium]